MRLIFRYFVVKYLFTFDSPYNGTDFKYNCFSIEFERNNNSEDSLNSRAFRDVLSSATMDTTEFK